MTLQEATSKGGRNTFEIWTAPPLPYFLITVKTTELEKISLSYMESLKDIC